MQLSPVEEQQRYEIVVARGMEVLRNRTALAVWLSRFNPAIGDGFESPARACRTASGFLQTMAELERLAYGSPSTILLKPPVAARDTREGAPISGN